MGTRRPHAVLGTRELGVTLDQRARFTTGLGDELGMTRQIAIQQPRQAGLALAGASRLRARERGGDGVVR